jgi:glycosyltransferase involved in cell wall biosynthesis
VTLMKIAVTHHSLNIPGGAERLCLSVIEALRKRGHEVSLITVEKTDWGLVQRNFGTLILPNNESYVTTSRLSSRLGSISISSTYFSIYLLQLLAHRSQKEYDLMINTFGDAINSVADVTYVHFPLRAALALSQIPAFTNESTWRIIAPLYDSATSFMDRITPGNLLTNSKFVQGIIRRFLGRNSLVVYPPVNVATFASDSFKDVKESSIVAVVASYTPKRHLEQVPLIAKYSKHAKFVIMGKADEYSATTLATLKEHTKMLHVEDRVTTLQNVPIKQFLETLSKAKVYLHIMPQDHFGISVVEAMASGCVPVVHKSGGPWIDILDEQQGTYGYSYSTPVEAAKYIDMLVTDEDLRGKISVRASKRARKYDKAVFMNRIVEVVEKIGS